jgi:EAL domain-containing protein (putative c-di-GMP-specific phosphodiesterase class I)
MAKSLKKSVGAEGVETEEQMRFLQTHACEEPQGYYFSKPMLTSTLLLEAARTTGWLRWAHDGLMKRVVL